MARFERFDADQVVRFELEGRLDSASVEQIEAPLTASLRDGTGNVMLDLRNVPFVGSLGIRMLVSAARAIQRQGRTLVLLGVQPQVLEVFDTVALGDLIPIAANQDEAAQLLAG
ncbi:MAG TPA: STAS domain-containing protein [Acetobacteraceae bacterium]|nr:STAS domain-containing protein [Acetobacteraceae bacterium]